MNKLLFFSGIVLLMASSCGPDLKYFTEDLYDSYQWSEEDLRRIQFYVSRDIVLYKRASRDGSTIEKGQIKIKEDERVQEIVIKRGTPGVFVQSPKDDRFAISFEDGRKNFLMFGPTSKTNGRFVLLAKDWDRKSGQISYGGEIYETSNESAYAALMVDIKKAGKTKYQSKKAEGQRVRR